MASITNFSWLVLLSIPALIHSYQVAKVSRPTPLEPSWPSVEVQESNFQPSARTDRYLRNNNRLLADPYAGYQRVDPIASSELPLEASFAQRSHEEIGSENELELSVADESNEDYETGEEIPPQPAEDRFFLGDLAPLALAGLSVPAVATLGLAGAVLLPLAGLALSSGFRRLFNPAAIPDGFTPGDAVLEGPAGQLLANLLVRDRKITLYNTEYAFTLLTRSTTSVNTASTLTSTGSTISYLVYFSTATWSSTTTSVSVSTYSSPVPTTYTSSATSSATSLSTVAYSSTTTVVTVTVPVLTESSTYTSSETSVSTTTSTPATETSTTTTTKLQATTQTEYTTYTSTSYVSTCDAFYP